MLGRCHHFRWACWARGTSPGSSRVGWRACHVGTARREWRWSRSRHDPLRRRRRLATSTGSPGGTLRTTHCSPTTQWMASTSLFPNTLHHDWTLKALGAGKPVLCEKPLGVSAAEVENMFDAADRAGKLLMEGFMYRCHPLTAAVLDAVRGGVIGTPRLVRASFCYRTRNTDPAGNIRFDPALAGGAPDGHRVLLRQLRPPDRGGGSPSAFLAKPSSARQASTNMPRAPFASPAGCWRASPAA